MSETTGSTGVNGSTGSTGRAERAESAGFVHVRSGMPAGELGAEGWHKPWSGTNGGSCVEAKRLPDGRVAFRQSTDPEGPALVYTRDEMLTFLEGAKAGLADFLVD